MKKENRSLIERLISAKKNFGPIEKKSRVKFKGVDFWYADLKELFDKTQKALMDEGLFIYQDVFTNEQGSTYVRSIIMCEEGIEKAEAQIEIPTAVLVDPKKTGAHITYFKRYLYAAQLWIAADDDKDAIVFDNETLNKKETGELASDNQMKALWHYKHKMSEEFKKAFEAKTLTKDQASAALSHYKQQEK